MYLQNSRPKESDGRFMVCCFSVSFSYDRLCKATEQKVGLLTNTQCGKTSQFLAKYLKKLNIQVNTQLSSFAVVKTQKIKQAIGNMCKHEGKSRHVGNMCKNMENENTSEK